MKLNSPLSDKRFLVSAAENLLAAQQEIDEFMLQVALGKAEAKEKFNDLKNDFKDSISSLKLQIQSYSDPAFSKKANDNLQLLDEELDKPSATLVDFEKQKARLLQLVESVQTDVEDWLEKRRLSLSLINDFEKFKLKLEVLELKFALKKFEIKEGVRHHFESSSKVLNKIVDGAEDTLQKGEDIWLKAKKTITDNYKHLRKALH